MLCTQAEQPPTQALLTPLLNALAGSDDHVALVLDDYQYMRVTLYTGAMVLKMYHQRQVGK